GVLEGIWSEQRGVAERLDALRLLAPPVAITGCSRDHAKSKRTLRGHVFKYPIAVSFRGPRPVAEVSQARSALDARCRARWRSRPSSVPVTGVRARPSAASAAPPARCFHGSA